MAKLASLIVDLQLQSAQLRSGLDEANRKLEEFAKQAERTANVLEGVFTFEALKNGLVSLGTFIKGGADAADAMGELAESIGVPVESLSKLAYAATFSGSSTEAVGKALAKTTDLMSKALAPTSEQAALFSALGISVTDADEKLRAADAVFSDIAQRFAETEDGAAKTALAIRIFGDEGTKLVPLLNNGAAGLAAFGEEAARTGNVITEKGATSAGQFNDALDRLRKASEGLALSVAQDLAPSLAAFAEDLTITNGRAETFSEVSSGLANVMRTVASAAVLMAGGLEIITKAAAGAAAWTVALFDDDARGAKSAEAVKAAWASMREVGEREGRQIDAIWKKSGPGAAMAKDAAQAKPSADAYVAAIDRTKKAAERAAESQKKMAEAAKKAAEESAKALDEYVKAALSLERQHAAIDRAAAKRAAEANGMSATEGFSDMEDALSRMALAQKAAATMRSRATEREKDGDLIGADSATRKADELTELAERASGAVDAFRAMGKEAEDAAARMLEEQVAAVAALERTFDGIEQDVAARREALSGANADPAEGFTTFNAALDAMAVALKDEATLRSQAAELERAGKLGEARQALLAAESMRALADQTSAAADALAEMERARAGVPGELGGMLAGGMGSTTSAALQGVETGAAAGPVGAVVGGLVGLLSQSETFQNALGSLEEIFQTLADSVGMLIEPLMPLLVVVSEVAAGLGALFEALSPIVEFVARPLFEVFKGFGMVVLSIVKFIGEIINGLAGIFGFKNRLDLGGIGEAMARLESASYDSAKEQNKVAEAARESVGALNTVSWWRESLARFDSVEQGRTGGPQGGSTPPPAVVDNSQTNIEVNGVTDPVEVARQVEEKIADRKNRRTGGSRDEWMDP